MRRDPDAATYVQVEIPLLAALPPPAQSNQTLLAAGLSRRTRPYVESTTETLPAVSLENVLIQLSPLESALHDARADRDVLTALWVVRRGERFQVTMFTSPHDPSVSDVDRRAIAGPLEIEFSQSEHAFVVRLGTEHPRLLDADIPEVHVKAFFIALDILRGLSESMKPDATASHSRQPCVAAPAAGQHRAGEGEGRPVGSAATLPPLRRFARAVHGTGIELPSAGILVLEVAEAFATLRTVQDVYGRARELVVDGLAIDLPTSATGDVSPAVAALVLNAIGG